MSLVLNVSGRGEVTITGNSIQTQSGMLFNQHGQTLYVKPCHNCGSSPNDITINGSCMVVNSSTPGKSVSSIGIPGGRIVVRGNAIDIQLGTAVDLYTVTINGSPVTVAAGSEYTRPPACTVCQTKYTFPRETAFCGLHLHGNVDVKIASTCVDPCGFNVTLKDNTDVETFGPNVHVEQVTVNSDTSGDAHITHLSAMNSLSITARGNGDVTARREASASVSKSNTGNGEIKVIR